MDFDLDSLGKALAPTRRTHAPCVRLQGVVDRPAIASRIRHLVERTEYIGKLQVRCHDGIWRVLADGRFRGPMAHSRHGVPVNSESVTDEALAKLLQAAESRYQSCNAMLRTAIESSPSRSLFHSLEGADGIEIVRSIIAEAENKLERIMNTEGTHLSVASAGITFNIRIPKSKYFTSLYIRLLGLYWKAHLGNTKAPECLADMQRLVDIVVNIDAIMLEARSLLAEFRLCKKGGDSFQDDTHDVPDRE